MVQDSNLKEQAMIVKMTMHRIIRSLPDLACIIDASGTIICANDGMKSLFGEQQLMITDEPTSFYDVLSESSVSSFQDTIRDVLVNGNMIPSLLIHHKSGQCSSQCSLNILHGIFGNYPDLIIINGKLITTCLAGHSSLLHHMFDDAVQLGLNSSTLKRVFVNPFLNKNKIYVDKVTARHDNPIKSQHKPVPQQPHSPPTTDCVGDILISSSKLHKYGQEGKTLAW
jgi:hypothetical protein